MLTSAQLQAPPEWQPRPPGASSGKGHVWLDECLLACWPNPFSASPLHPKLAESGVCCRNHTLLKKLGGKLRTRAGSALPKVTPCHGALLCGLLIQALTFLG